MLTEADHLVVLAKDLGGAFGKIEGEGGLVGAKVVDVEDKLFGEVFGGAPDDPAYAGIDLGYVSFVVQRETLSWRTLTKPYL